MKAITRERESRGWSRAELARRANMNAGTIGLFENGRLLPYAGQLDKIAAALGWPGDPAGLMEEVDHERQG